MSPAAKRRYAVQFEDWTVYEATVFASSAPEAIEKAKAIYNLNGLAELSAVESGDSLWHARCLDEEVAS
ncbi:hypothetical protein [Bradyrhizobium sp. SZCCHNRI20481]|uniref:hypothetical protein n=1 Tax=Bradyrhizobium sp. SZCCHNRI20481 TaxID=3057286 RepID=UPI002915EDA6|nr:hypothetical protein [Bradyrhizobium sp. SZCCHNRI20481]